MSLTSAFSGINPHPCLSHKAALYRRGREVILTSKSPQALASGIVYTYYNHIALNNRHNTRHKS
jgi:hypothetical protein